MSITLYHSVESTCSQKVRFVLAEKKLEWQETWLNLRKGEQFDPGYLKLNPKAVVPTLVHDGRVVRESTVIVEYLDDVFPQPPLRPADFHDRARMRLILKAFDEEAHPAIGILSYAIVLRHQMKELKSPEELEAHFSKIVDPGRRERQKSTHEHGLKSPPARVAIDMLRKLFDLLEDSLGKGQWLAGSAFSLADAAAVPYMVRARALKLGGLWRDKAGIDNWLARAVDKGNSYPLDNPWGSNSFREVVEKCASDDSAEIEKLISDRNQAS